MSRHFTVTALFLDDGLPEQLSESAQELLCVILHDIAEYDAGWFNDYELADRMANHGNACLNRAERRQDEHCSMLYNRCMVAESLLDPNRSRRVAV